MVDCERCGYWAQELSDEVGLADLSWFWPFESGADLVVNQIIIIGSRLAGAFFMRASTSLALLRSAGINRRERHDL